MYIAIFSFLFCKSILASETYAMADLWVTDWNHFRSQLMQAKELGIEGISVDVWWGRVQQSSPDQFDWGYYHRIFKEIRDAQLKIIPILSTHACGGNVGDTVNIPLPQWFLEKHQRLGTGLEFVSGAGNRNYEYPSFWTTEKILPDFVKFWSAFQDEFKRDQDIIAEIPIGLGPSGELHYPSHHSHDSQAGFAEAQYPNRGLLQAFSPAAYHSFQQWTFNKKYPGKTAREIGNLWGFTALNQESISPWLILYPHIPDDPRWRVNRITEFFQNQKHKSGFGRDFFEWYHQSLLNHFSLVMEKAVEVFHSKSSAFQNIHLAAKVPGIHWGASRGRLPSLMSGLVSLSSFDDADLGFRSLFEAYQKLKFKHKNSLFSVTYTASEFPDTEDSNAGKIAQVFFQLAREYGISVSAENALSASLYDPSHVERLFKYVDDHFTQRLVLLRLSDALSSESTRKEIASRRCSRLLTK